MIPTMTGVLVEIWMLLLGAAQLVLSALLWTSLVYQLAVAQLAGSVSK